MARRRVATAIVACLLLATVASPVAPPSGAQTGGTDDAVPAGLAADLVLIDLAIEEAATAIEKFDGFDAAAVIGLLNKVREAKAFMIGEDFPKLFGHSAAKVILPLIDIDVALYRALYFRLAAANTPWLFGKAAKTYRDAAAKAIAQAKRAKEALEKLLRSQVTTAQGGPTTTSSTSTSTIAPPTTTATSSTSTTTAPTGGGGGGGGVATSSSTTSSTATTAPTTSTTAASGAFNSSFGWHFIDASEVLGTGSFSQSPGGAPLDGVRVVIPASGGTARSITNQLCPSQLPAASISTTTNPNDTLTCTGGSLPVGQSFELYVRMSPGPSEGMGGQLFGRQNGTFSGPIPISGPS